MHSNTISPINFYVDTPNFAVYYLHPEDTFFFKRFVDIQLQIAFQYGRHKDCYFLVWL